MGVIVIYKDYEMIGIAKDNESAINFLFDNYFLVPLKDLNISIENIKQMDIDKFNELFDDLFYLDIETVWGMWYNIDRKRGN